MEGTFTFLFPKWKKSENLHWNWKQKKIMWVTGLYEARTTPTHQITFNVLIFFSWMSWIQTVNFFFVLSVFVEEFSFSFSPCLMIIFMVFFHFLTIQWCFLDIFFWKKTRRSNYHYYHYHHQVLKVKNVCVCFNVKWQWW